MSFKYSLAFALLLSVAGCECNKNPPVVKDDPSTKPSHANVVQPPDFSADSAYAYTQTQVNFAPRVPGTPAQMKCAAYFESFFKRLTPNVIVQQADIKIYNGKTVPCRNIFASFNPDNPKRILLFAHWDTRPWADRDSINPRAPLDGADDGAASAAILMEIARLISTNPLRNVGVDIALFDVEDYGPPSFEEGKWIETDQYALGTQYWTKNPHKPNYRAYYGILLDMCSSTGARFPIEGVSAKYAPTVAQRVWSLGQSLGYGQYFVNERANAVIDDHYYVNLHNGTPSIDVIHLSTHTAHGFAPHWHTTKDNMSVISKETMKAVGHTVLYVLYNEPPFS
ncbi:MAG TPA: M28 family peptidase [Chitinophagales bacterium]|nr:M28 family peptidase [Chitinophagales bacterium]